MHMEVMVDWHRTTAKSRVIGTRWTAVYKKYGLVLHALAAQMTRVIALTLLAALGLFGKSFPEPFHARGPDVPLSCYSA